MKKLSLLFVLFISQGAWAQQTGTASHWAGHIQMSPDTMWGELATQTTAEVFFRHGAPGATKATALLVMTGRVRQNACDYYGNVGPLNVRLGSALLFTVVHQSDGRALWYRMTPEVRYSSLPIHGPEPTGRMLTDDDWTFESEHRGNILILQGRTPPGFYAPRCGGVRVQLHSASRNTTWSSLAASDQLSLSSGDGSRLFLSQRRMTLDLAREDYCGVGIRGPTLPHFYWPHHNTPLNPGEVFHQPLPGIVLVPLRDQFDTAVDTFMANILYYQGTQGHWTEVVLTEVANVRGSCFPSGAYFQSN